MPVVVLFSYSGTLGGAERVLLDLATALPGERWLACPEGELAQAARAAGVRVRTLRARPLELRSTTAARLSAARHLVAHAREAGRVVRDLAPELVVANGMRSAIALLDLQHLETPVVFLHHDLLPGPLIARAVRRAAAAADLVAVPSHVVADDLGVRARPVVIAPGVDVEALSGLPEPTHPPEVLVLGALVGWKRPDLALEIASLARRRLPTLRLRFVGEPLSADGALERLRRRAAEPDLADAVEFAGRVADPAPELARASCLLHCAEREPFGLVVAEAMAAGRPVVAPYSGGTAEIVDEECARLYPPGDARGGAEALVEVLGDPELAHALGSRGRARARERFDRRSTSRELASAALSLLPARGQSDATRDELTLLTVTHNSAGELAALMRSVEQHLPGTQVVAVDCASADESVAVARDCEFAVSVALEENVGFGRACNLGLAEIATPVCALVNPDVELLDNSLLVLATEARRADRPERLLAPLVLSPDGSRQDTVHPAPGSRPALIGSVLPLPLVPGAAPWRSRTPRRVGWAVGCALVASTETLRRLGPFDSTIFMYGEDLELGLRAGRSGIETWFDPRARVLHHRAHSTRSEFGGEPFERLARARRDVLARQAGPRRVALDDAAQSATFITRIAAKTLLGRSAERERQQLRALRRARR